MGSRLSRMSGNTGILVAVRCPQCGQQRDVSYRSARRIETGELSGKCRSCISPVTVTQAHRNYWLDRFTITEIRELAAGLDLLLNDHSRPARGRQRREWDEAA